MVTNPTSQIRSRASGSIMHVVFLSWRRTISSGIMEKKEISRNVACSGQRCGNTELNRPSISLYTGCCKTQLDLKDTEIRYLRDQLNQHHMNKPCRQSSTGILAVPLARMLDRMIGMLCGGSIYENDNWNFVTAP